MHLKQIGIIVGGGGLLIFFALMGQSQIENAHDTGASIQLAETQTIDRSGFTVATPQGFKSQEATEGVVFVEDGQIRTPLMVRIDLRPSVDFETSEERRLANGLARYKVDELEGGSAGPLWQLNAVKDTAQGVLVMEASQQAELGPPNFAKAWEIFESIEVEN